MTPNRDKLQQTLHELHAQLEAADAVDSDLADELRRALAEIQTALARRAVQGEAPHEDETLQDAIASTPETLEAAALHFAQSHPTISGTLRRLIDVLGQMGI